MIFISRVFPLEERSGLNLKGEINTECIAHVTDRIEMNEFAKFHFNFWNLRNIFYKPIEALSNWELVKDSIFDVFKYFRSTPTCFTEDTKYSKCINSISIFKFELKNTSFRIQFLLELLIFLNELLQFLAKGKSVMALSKTEEPKTISDDQLQYINNFIVDCRANLNNIIPSKSKLRNDFIDDIILQENSYSIWKSNSCPPPPNHSKCDIQKRSKYIYDFTRFSSFEENKSEENDEKHIAEIPSLEDHLNILKEQLDPDECVEEEYRVSNSEVFE